MRTIYPSGHKPSGPPQNDPQIHKAAHPKWYSREYLASIWARRPAEVLAALVFTAIVAVLLMVFAAGPESHSLSLCGTGGGTRSNTTCVSGKVQLSPQQSTGLKAPALGVMDEAKIPTGNSGGHNWQDVVNMSVIQVDWSTLQPNSTNDAIPHPSNACATGAPTNGHNQNGYLNPIDCRISQIRAINANITLANKKQGIKIRVFAGSFAPGWAKNLPHGGSASGPVHLCDPQGSACGDVGPFWTSTYENDYAALQQKLAALYDATPEIRDITISGCMTIYAEPFQRGLSSSNEQALHNAGFTATQDKQCELAQIDVNNVWVQTRSSLALNPYQNPDTDSTDEAFTEQAMDHCRSVLGARCNLENNSIRDTTTVDGSDYGRMYAKMKALGGPMTFQTAASGRIGDWVKTLRWAVGEGANAVEINPGYATNYDYNTLSGLDAQLEANSYQ